MLYRYKVKACGEMYGKHKKWKMEGTLQITDRYIFPYLFLSHCTL
jgi:hypothetical protein